MFEFIKRLFREEPVEPCADGPGPSGPWFGVDLDGTLAVWDANSSLDRIGPPVPAMVDYVRRMIANGIRVKIFTARAADPAHSSSPPRSTPTTGTSTSPAPRR